VQDLFVGIVPGMDEPIPGARVGLFTSAFALIVLVAGSLLFPDKEKKAVIHEKGKIHVPTLVGVGLFVVVLLGFLSWVYIQGEWELLWKIVLVGGILLFGILALVVSIGGARDVKRLFAAIRRGHEENQDT